VPHVRDLGITISYVRLIVGWSPLTLQDIDAIERVQKRFTNSLPELRECSYEVHLKRLSLQSLELRRLHNDIIWCYKIVFGFVDTHS